MNKVELIGRLTKDPEIRYSNGDNHMMIANFTLAVNRRMPNAQGEYEADFIRCVSFGKTAEFADKYFHQGTKIAVCGRIQTGSYTNRDRQKIYTTVVVVEEQEFAESRKDKQDDPSGKNDGFTNIPDGSLDDEMPFH